MNVGIQQTFPYCLAWMAVRDRSASRRSPMSKAINWSLFLFLLGSTQCGLLCGSDFSITSFTFASAPDGTGSDRRIIGVSEIVQFNANASAD